MNTVKEFFDNLSSTNKDRFISVIRDMENIMNRNEIDNIDKEIADTVDKINVINNKRGVLTKRKEDIKKLLDCFGEKDVSFEINMLKQYFLMVYNDLKKEIIETKPVDLLYKKTELIKKKESAASISKLGSEIGELLKRG